jgi:hypothetical protein
MTIMSVPIGHDAHGRARAQHRLGLWRPSVCRPVVPFSRFRYHRDDGEPMEIVVWLPGPHPEDAAWWEDLSVWVAVRAA